MRSLSGLWRRISAPVRAPRRILIEWAAVGVFSSAVVIWFCLGDAAQRTDNAIYDALMETRGGVPDERILVVAIDNRSLEALGRWPWPRRLHAEAIERLQASGARAVGYDILFVEPADGDDRLAQAIGAAGNVYLPMAVDPMSASDGERSALQPVANLRTAAAGLGHVNLTVDGDGTVRRLPVGLRTADGGVPHLAVRLAAAAGWRPPPGVSTGEAPPLLLSWRGAPGSHRAVSFVDVLRGEIPADMIAGKLVLVGMTADGQGDRYAGPVGEGRLYPGVEIQATMLDTLLAGRALHRPPDWVVALLSLGFLWPVLWLLLALGPTRGLVATGLGVLAAFGAGASAFAFGVWIAPTGAVAGILLAYPLWSWRRLEAANAWFRGQLDLLLGDDALPPPLVGGDSLQRQLDAMRWAIQRLRNLGRFINDALRGLPDATVVTGQDGRVMMANERAESLFGARPLNGRMIDDLLEALGGRADVATGERVTRSGRVLDVGTAPLVDEAGETVGRIMRLADVTPMRTAQRHREEALQLLSHDMRSPQISILTLLERAGDDLEPNLSRRIGDSARLTLRMAEGYVHLARAESTSLTTEPVDLLEAMTDAADTLWPVASQRGVRIVLPTSSEPALVAGDRQALTRVFLNLLDNAVRFSPAGASVEIRLQGPGVNPDVPWTCTVEDRGPGVPPELCTAVFRPFERADARPSGVGLGLAFVRTVVERHGGRARCEARPGGGARFVLQLPRAA